MIDLKNASVKKMIGAKITRVSILFVAFVTLVPLSVLMFESHFRSSVPKVWWLEPVPASLKYKVTRTKKSKVVHPSNFHSLWAEQQNLLATLLWSAALTKGPFCASHANEHKFPIRNSVPPDNEPWIWDAVLTDGGSLVSVLLLDRFRCKFNQSTWINQLKASDVNVANESLMIFINAPKGTSSDRRKGTVSRLTCRFYDQRSLLLTTSESLGIVGDTLVRCPVPFQLRGRANLLLKLQPPPHFVPGKGETQASRPSNIFPACPLPPPINSLSVNFNLSHSSSMGANASMSASVPRISQVDSMKIEVGKNQSNLNSWTTTSTTDTGPSSGSVFAYNVSVCAVAPPPPWRERALLVEWIEYHRLLGVEHFFIYDTLHSPSSTSTSSTTTMMTSSERAVGADEMNDDDNDDQEKSAQSVRAGLVDYIALGLVTVVPWHFAGCGDNNAACARRDREEGRGGGGGATWGPEGRLWDGAEGAMRTAPPTLEDTQVPMQSCYVRFHSSSR